ncbi:hypothetical protein GGQ85_002933 [Nitrobacter vulgaris]|jgi:hypothetical protein|nr:hypothetical protein [Nitrobacter vulgaris]
MRKVDALEVQRKFSFQRQAQKDPVEIIRHGQS